MTEVNLNRRRPDPTLSELSRIMEVNPDIRTLWAHVNTIKGIESEKTAFFVELLHELHDKMDECERNALTDRQLNEMAEKTAAHLLYGINETDYMKLKEAIRRTLIEELKQKHVISVIKTALPNDATISRLSLSERTFFESIRGIVQHWQEQSKSITAQTEPSAGEKQIPIR